MIEYKYPTLEDLELGCRVYPILRAAGIVTAGDLAATSRGQLLRMRGIGKRTVREIEEALGRHGMFLADDEFLPPDRREAIAELRREIDEAQAIRDAARARVEDAEARFRALHSNLEEGFASKLRHLISGPVSWVERPRVRRHLDKSVIRCSVGFELKGGQQLCVEVDGIDAARDEDMARARAAIAAAIRAARKEMGDVR